MLRTGARDTSLEIFDTMPFLTKIYLGSVLVKQMSSIQGWARNVEYVFYGGEVTGCSGVLFAMCVAEKSGLCGLLETELNCALKKRKCSTMEGCAR